MLTQLSSLFGSISPAFIVWSCYSQCIIRQWELLHIHCCHCFRSSHWAVIIPPAQSLIFTPSLGPKGNLGKIHSPSLAFRRKSHYGFYRLTAVHCFVTLWMEQYSLMKQQCCCWHADSHDCVATEASRFKTVGILENVIRIKLTPMRVSISCMICRTIALFYMTVLVSALGNYRRKNMDVMTFFVCTTKWAQLIITMTQISTGLWTMHGGPNESAFPFSLRAGDPPCIPRSMAAPYPSIVCAPLN